MDKRKRYRIRHFEKIRAASAIWRSMNQEKRKAHQAIRSAVKAGRIIKPVECQCCGSVKPLQAHHHDYSMPLDVQWLCAACHAKEHGTPIVATQKTFYRGESHHQAKLTESSVMEIRQKWSAGGISKRMLAKLHGVSDRNIRLILKGETWKHTNS